MTTKFGQSILCAVTLAVTAAVPGALAGESVGCQSRGHESSVTINARPEVVYRNLMNLREDDSDCVKAISRKPNECLVEETFTDLPMIGKAKCIYKEHYTPLKRIEYKMVESDKFKAFEGRWIITPLANGEKTQVSLSSYVEIDTNIPFSKQLTAIQTKKEVKERLTAIKKASEEQPVSLSQSQAKSSATVR